MGSLRLLFFHFPFWHFPTVKSRHYYKEKCSVLSEELKITENDLERLSNRINS